MIPAAGNQPFPLFPFTPWGGTFDPAKTSAHMALSNGNLTVGWDEVAPANYYSSVGTVSYPYTDAKVLYCEFTLTTSSLLFTRTFGLFSGQVPDGAIPGAQSLAADGNVTAYVCDTLQGLLRFTDSGAAPGFGSYPYFASAPVAGDVIGMLWDQDAGELSFTCNGTGPFPDTHPFTTVLHPDLAGTFFFGTTSYDAQVGTVNASGPSWAFPPV